MLLTVHNDLRIEREKRNVSPFYEVRIPYDAEILSGGNICRDYQIMGDGESRPAGSDGKSIHGAGNAEMAEQAFCMVAGDGRLAHGGGSVRKHARQ